MGKLSLGQASPCSPLPMGRGKDAAHTRLSPQVSAGGSSGPGAREVTDGDMSSARPLSARWRTDPQMAAASRARATARGQASTGPWGSGPFVGVSPPAAAPSPAAPHQPFNFQLDLLLSHGNGMQMEPGGLPGAIGCNLPAGPPTEIWGIITTDVGRTVVPGERGPPCPPAMEQQTKKTVPTALS